MGKVVIDHDTLVDALILFSPRDTDATLMVGSGHNWMSEQSQFIVTLSIQQFHLMCVCGSLIHFI